MCSLGFSKYLTSLDSCLGSPVKIVLVCVCVFMSVQAYFVRFVCLGGSKISCLVRFAIIVVAIKVFFVRIVSLG